MGPAVAPAAPPRLTGAQERSGSGRLRKPGPGGRPLNQAGRGSVHASDEPFTIWRYAPPPSTARRWIPSRLRVMRAITSSMQSSRPPAHTRPGGPFDLEAPGRSVAECSLGSPINNRGPGSPHEATQRAPELRSFASPARGVSKSSGVAGEGRHAASWIDFTNADDTTEPGMCFVELTEDGNFSDHRLWPDPNELPIQRAHLAERDLTDGRGDRRPGDGARGYGTRRFTIRRLIGGLSSARPARA